LKEAEEVTEELAENLIEENEIERMQMRFDVRA
jgi:hypothetical protein